MGSCFFRATVIRCVTAVALLCLATTTVARPRRAPKRPFTIAVLADGPLDANLADMVSRIERETRDIIGDERRVVFPKDKHVVANWKARTIVKAAAKLLADPDVDLIVSVGYVGAVQFGRIAQAGKLTKPVLSTLAIDPRYSKLPAARDRRTSARKNFNYLVYRGTFGEDIGAFVRLTHERTIHVLVDREMLKAMPTLVRLGDAVSRRRGVKLIPVAAGGRGRSAARAIPSSARAVYVGPLPQMSDAEKSVLFKQLQKRRLPTFSLNGRSEVNRGALATLTRGIDFLRVARRLALNIERVMRGEDPADFSITLRRTPRLIINMQVAKKIGFSPSWQVMAFAELAGENEDDAPPMTLAEAMKAAIKANVAVRAAEKKLAAAESEHSATFAGVLPRVDLTAGFSTINKQVADASLGTRPQHQLVLGAKLQQNLLVEPAIANISIKSHTRDAQKAALTVSRLDAVAKAANTFLDLLRAEANARIQKNNALTTAENLEAAKVRRKIGSTGPSDVLRWKSQLANDRRNSIVAQGQVEIARFALNQLLNRKLTKSFAPVALSQRDPTLLPNYSDLIPYLNTPAQFSRFCAFAVREAYRASPELKQLDAQIAAIDRVRLSRKLALFLPQLAVTGDLSYQLYRKFGDNAIAGALPPNIQLDEQPRLRWGLGVGLSVPLFAGFGQYNSYKRSDHQLTSLKFQRQRAAQRIALRVRVALVKARVASASIRFAQAPAAAARANFKVVSDGYSGGVVSIVRLLDAQNAMVKANIAAATAVFAFLKRIVDFQRASGRFELFVSRKARDAWWRRLRRYFDQGADDDDIETEDTTNGDSGEEQ